MQDQNDVSPAYHTSTNFYKCNPEKAKGCRKDNCYLNGGRCRLTMNPKWGDELYVDEDCVIYERGKKKE